MDTKIGQAIKAKGLTHEQIAQQLGVTRQAVTQWATGKTKPSFARLKSLSELLGESIDYLAGTEAAQEPPYRLAKLSATDAEPAGDCVRVPVLDVYGACGAGAEPTAGDIVGAVDFQTTFLRSLPGVVGFHNLHIVNADGDSMEPTISDRAFCLVDCNQRELRRDGVFCLQVENQIFIKRIQRNLDGTLTLLSDNDLYQPRTIGKEEISSLRIVGRVIYAFNGRTI